MNAGQGDGDVRHEPQRTGTRPTRPTISTFTSASHGSVGSSTRSRSTVALYDGDRLLVTSSGMGVGTVFHGPAWNFGAIPAAFEQFIDFTSLLDGTIAGRLEHVADGRGVRVRRGIGSDWLLSMDVQPTGKAPRRSGTGRQVQYGHRPEWPRLGVGWLRFRSRRKRRQEDAPAR